MKVWLELSKDEAEKVFDFIQGNFKVEGRKTAVLGTQSNDSQAEANVEANEKANEEPTNWQTNDEVVNQPVVKEEPTVTLEQIRAILQAKRLAGKTAGVASLVKSYGVTSLPDISPDNYPELLVKAEAL